MHPDARNSVRTPEEILKEFVETFKDHHLFFSQGVSVTQEEFEEYYNSISLCILHDEEFAAIIRNVWKIDEEKPVKKEEGLKQPTAAYAKPARSPLKTGITNMSSKENILNVRQEQPDISIPQKQTPRVSTAAYHVLFKFRKSLFPRGCKALYGLARQFKLMDDQNLKALGYKEFSKAIKDYKIQVDERDIKTVFEAFNKEAKGFVDYYEFISAVRGEMNIFRRGLVELTFNKLDSKAEGSLDVNELKKSYSGKSQMEVKTGKLTAEQACSEFSEILDLQFKVGEREKEDKIIKDEFHHVYENISASIDDDKKFEIAIVNAWNLYGDSASPQKGRPLTASQKAPFGTTEEPTVYKPSFKTQNIYQEEAKSILPAGQPTWPKIESARPKSTQVSFEEKQLATKFKQILLSRGTNGMFGLRRAFKVIYKLK